MDEEPKSLTVSDLISELHAWQQRNYEPDLEPADQPDPEVIVEDDDDFNSTILRFDSTRSNSPTLIVEYPHDTCDEMYGELKGLLAEFRDDNECSLDHNGNCQMHDFFDLNGELCPQERLKRALAD